VSTPSGPLTNKRIGHDCPWLAKITCQTEFSLVENTLYVTMIVVAWGPSLTLCCIDSHRQGFDNKSIE